MSYYILNHRLRGDENYSDYSRVFTAAISYRAIYDDILNIIDGNDSYEGKGYEEKAMEQKSIMDRSREEMGDLSVFADKVDAMFR